MRQRRMKNIKTDKKVVNIITEYGAVHSNKWFELQWKHFISTDFHPHFASGGVEKLS